MINKNILFVQQLGDLNKPDPYLCASYLEPITLEYLAAYIGQKGYSTKILAGNISFDELSSAIEKTTPSIIGFSIYTYTYNHSLLLAKAAKGKAKELGYDIVTVFGGYHASAMPEEVASNDEADFVVKGEGEITFLELLETLSKGEDTSKIPGLFLKNNGKIVQTSARDRIKDIDFLPWPIHEKKFILNAKQYQLIYPPPSEQKSVARITYSRGCPYACDFCCSKNTWGQNVYWRSPKDVLDEIEMLNKKYGTNLISFLDLTFNANKQKVLEICDEFIKRNLDIYWWGLFRADLLDQEMLNALSKAKCVKLNIGIESPNENLAGKIKTSYVQKKERITENLKIANNLGILLKAFLIIGFDNETKEDILSYPESLKKFTVDELRVTFATPFPATSLWDHCIKNNILKKPFEWDKFTTEDPIIKHPTISDNELIELRKHLVLSFYLNFSYYEHLKSKLEKFPHLKNAYLEYFLFIKDNGIFNDNLEEFNKLIDIIKNVT